MTEFEMTALIYNHSLQHGTLKSTVQNLGVSFHIQLVLIERLTYELSKITLNNEMQWVM